MDKDMCTIGCRFMYIVLPYMSKTGCTNEDVFERKHGGYGYTG